MQSFIAKAVTGSFFGKCADLRLLLWLRVVAILGQSIALTVSVTMLDIKLPYATLAAGIALLAGLNLFTWYFLKRASSANLDRVPYLDQRAFYYQIHADLAVLTFLLYFSGGPQNPFHDMYLLPLTAAAVALPWTYVWRVVLVSMAAYSFVSLYHVPLDLEANRIQDLMAFGHWVNHILLAALIAYFVVRISADLRIRDRELEEAHAKELRNGCAVAIGSVAAGAAHELGSPLSTIHVLLSELRSEHANEPELKANLDVMSGRLEECKKILGSLRTFVHSLNQSNQAIPVDVLINEVARRFRNIRPGISLTCSLNGPQPVPSVVPDLAFEQAIINLLNNAGDVSPNAITLDADWNEQALSIRVCDHHGPGISDELAAELGKILFTTKPPEEGTGLGLFLTNVTMNRLGGRLRLFNQPTGGVCAELILPLNQPCSAGAKP